MLDIADRMAITETLNRYAWALDEARYDLLQQIFTEDAEFTVAVDGGSFFGPFTGLDTIVAFFKSAKSAQTDKRRHVVSCALIDESGPAVKSGSYLTVFSITDKASIATTGAYDDEWRKVGGNWRIRKRHLRLDSMF